MKKIITMFLVGLMYWKATAADREYDLPELPIGTADSTGSLFLSSDGFPAGELGAFPDDWLNVPHAAVGGANSFTTVSEKVLFEQQEELDKLRAELQEAQKILKVKTQEIVRQEGVLQEKITEILHREMASEATNQEIARQKSALLANQEALMMEWQTVARQGEFLQQKEKEILYRESALSVATEEIARQQLAFFAAQEALALEKQARSLQDSVLRENEAEIIRKDKILRGHREKLDKLTSELREAQKALAAEKQTRSLQESVLRENEAEIMRKDVILREHREALDRLISELREAQEALGAKKQIMALQDENLKRIQGEVERLEAALQDSQKRMAQQQNYLEAGNRTIEELERGNDYLKAELSRAGGIDYRLNLVHQQNMFLQAQLTQIEAARMQAMYENQKLERLLAQSQSEKEQACNNNAQPNKRIKELEDALVRSEHWVTSSRRGKEELQGRTIAAEKKAREAERELRDVQQKLQGQILAAEKKAREAEGRLQDAQQQLAKVNDELREHRQGQVMRIPIVELRVAQKRPERPGDEPEDGHPSQHRRIGEVVPIN